MDHIDRRTFLCGGCAAFAVGCGQGTNGVSFGGTGDTGPGSATTDGPLANPDYPCNQVIEPGGEGWQAVSLTTNPQLAEVGGSMGVAVVGTSPAKFILIAQVQPGCFVAVARECTHQKVWVEYDPDRQAFVCPRDAAVFDWDGYVTGGPAPLPLKVFTAGQDGDKVWVDVSDWV